MFEGIRVFFHEGIGCGKFYTTKDCESMLLQHEGLNEDTVGELRMTTSTLQEGDVARERTSGQGSRLLRGTEHKDYDAAVSLQKEVKKNDVKVQKEETAKDTGSTTVAESGVMVCRHCSKGFVRQQWFRSHEEGCVCVSAVVPEGCSDWSATPVTERQLSSAQRRTLLKARRIRLQV